MRQFVINRKHKCLLMLIANWITHNEVLNCRYHILCNDISPLELIQNIIDKNKRKEEKKRNVARFQDLYLLVLIQCK